MFWGLKGRQEAMWILTHIPSVCGSTEGGGAKAEIVLLLRPHGVRDED